MAAIKIGDFVKITFESEQDTSITQLDTGTVALLLQDNVSHIGTYTITNENQIPSVLAKENQEYIRLALRGRPQKVIAVVQEGSATAVAVKTDTFGVLETLSFDYLAIPGLSEADAAAVAKWVTSVNANPIHRFSCVLPNTEADDGHVINFAQTSVTISGKAYTTTQATPWVAGYLAANIPGRSMTMLETDADACSAMTIAEIDAAGEDGALVLFDTGEVVRFANDVNSLTTVGDTQDETYQDIRCTAIMDLFYNSAKVQILEKYIGKFPNTYQNKLLLVSEVYSLLKSFERSGLCEQGDTDCNIHVDAQTEYLRSVNYKTKDGRGVDDMTQDEILRANTRKKVFLKCRMKPLGAIESVEILVQT